MPIRTLTYTQEEIIHVFEKLHPGALRVDVEVNSTSRGYGVSEHTVHEVEVVVTLGGD